MSRHHRRRKRNKLRSFYIWHRYMGIGAAIVAVLMAITGGLLNHTEDFQFDSQHVQSNWVLDWYGIKAPENMLSFSASGHSITLMGKHLYLNRKEIDSDYRLLVGAVHLNDMYIVAVSNGILLLTPHGEIIEHLRERDKVPAGIKQLGVDRTGAVVVRTSHDLYQPDPDFIRWSRWNSDPATIQWAESSPIEPKLKASLRHHFRREVLPVERVLLDLHSGRFFGQLGPWLFDIAAILLILLSLSGTWIWLKRRR